MTLRYNPDEYPRLAFGLRPLTAKHFMVGKQPSNPALLESLIKGGIIDAIEDAKPKKIVVPLSGGVDSTLILVLTQEVVKEHYEDKIQIVGLTQSFSDSMDETGYAKRTAQKLGVDLHTIRTSNVLERLPELIQIVGLPKWNLYYYYVVQGAKEIGSDLILTGDGGDELFAGYTFRYKTFIENLYWDNGHYPTEWPYHRVACYLLGHNRDWVEDQAEFFHPRMGFSWRNMFEMLVESFDNRLDELDQLFLQDFNGKLLCDFVPTNNLFYRHFKIPGYAPMLNDAIIRLSCTLSPADKYDNNTGVGKLPLRQIIASKGLGEYVLKEKRGYGMNVVQFWERQGKAIVEELLLRDIDNTAIIKNQIINKAWVLKHIDDIATNPRYISKMLCLYALELWLRGQQSQQPQN